MAAQEVTETLLSAVHRLEPLIREYADEAERNRRLSHPVATALAEAGFLRLYLPRTLGGLEVDPPDILPCDGSPCPYRWSDRLVYPDCEYRPRVRADPF